MRRDGTLHTITLELPTPTVTPAATVVAAPTPPAALPAPEATADTGLRISGADTGALASMVAALRTFAAATVDTSPRAEVFNPRFAKLRQTYDSLKTQDPAVGTAAPIMGYYDTAAAILVYEDEHKDDQVPDDSSPRRIEGNRRQPGMVYDYPGKGPVADWLTRYPFLEAAVIRAPIGNADGWQLTGRWLPDDAVRLLLERAGAGIAALK